MQENIVINTMPHGTVHIADDVIEIIASIATAEVEGIKHLTGSFSEEMMEKIGKKTLSKGVTVDQEEGKISIGISIVVDYGVKILEISKEVQENVKIAVESMTGLNVQSVNVLVHGINFSKKA